MPDIGCSIAADELRAQIVRGTLAPGSHLGQDKTAELLGLSKVPVREALRLLATEGFLRHGPNRGFFVAPLEVEEARQFYQLRRWVETQLLETAEWPTAAEIARFRRQFDHLTGIDQINEFNAWSGALAKLRYSLFDLSPRKVLLREARRLWLLTDRYRMLMPGEQGESAERRLIDAFERRDRAALLTDFLAARAEVEATLELALVDWQERQNPSLPPFIAQQCGI